MEGPIQATHRRQLYEFLPTEAQQALSVYLIRDTFVDRRRSLRATRAFRRSVPCQQTQPSREFRPPGLTQT